METPRPISLAQLRRYAIARTLFAPTDLAGAIERLGFVQADPIRAPARAQDLTLRHRVAGYRAGDLERQYASLDVEEDFFINYGFVTRRGYALMRPRPTRGVWNARDRRRVRDLVAFVRERGAVHPREVEAHFAHGRVTNFWGGISSATTHLLESMHYHGLLRVVRRDRGIRVYALAAAPSDGAESIDRPAVERRLDALIDLVTSVYAPLPAESFGPVAMRLRFAVPQWRPRLQAAIARARRRLGTAAVEGKTYYFPADEDPWSATHVVERQVRLLAPFDPLVWDRRRFERFWGWAYRFEAYTPRAKRERGYYALPLLHGEQVIGWANATVEDGRLQCAPGFVATAPGDRAFTRALASEARQLAQSLGSDTTTEAGAVGVRELE